MAWHAIEDQLCDAVVGSARHGRSRAALGGVQTPDFIRGKVIEVLDDKGARTQESYALAAPSRPQS